MKKFFLSISMITLLCSGALSFATTENPQDTNRKDKKSRPERRTDTASDTRLRKNDLPPRTRNDSIPMPQPLPDTIPVPLR